MPLLSPTRCLVRCTLLILAAFVVYPACAQYPGLPANGKADEASSLSDMLSRAGQDAERGPLPNVRKLGDNDLSCDQIHAEAGTLQKAGEEQRAEAEAAAQAVSNALNEMMQQAMTSRGKSGGGAGMGMLSSVSGLLGMIPGNAGMAANIISRIVSRVASQAAEDANSSEMPDNMKAILAKMMEVQQKMANAEGDMYYTQARHDYLVDLFLKKDCKLSQVKTAAQQTRQ